jgi:hypothetical protein
MLFPELDDAPPRNGGDGLSDAPFGFVMGVHCYLGKEQGVSLGEDLRGVGLTSRWNIEGFRGFFLGVFGWFLFFSVVLILGSLLFGCFSALFFLVWMLVFPYWSMSPWVFFGLGMGGAAVWGFLGAVWLLWPVRRRFLF